MSTSDQEIRRYYVEVTSDTQREFEAWMGTLGTLGVVHSFSDTAPVDQEIDTSALNPEYFSMLRDNSGNVVPVITKDHLKKYEETLPPAHKSAMRFANALRHPDNVSYTDTFLAYGPTHEGSRRAALGIRADRATSLLHSLQLLLDKGHNLLNIGPTSVEFYKGFCDALVLSAPKVN